MPKKVRPRWGWHPTHDGKDADAREGRIDLDRVAAILGIQDETVRVELWKEVGLAVGSYYFEAYDNPPPSKAEMRSGLRELQARADAMAFSMRELDYQSWQWVAPAIARMAEPGQVGPAENEDEGEIPFGPTPLDVKWAETRAFMELVSRAAQETAAHITPPRPRRGRKPNTPLLETIQRLADLYERHTHRNAYTSFYYDAESREYGGPFFLLVSEVFDAFEPEVQRTNNTLGETIRRAIGDRAKPNGEIEP